MRSLMKHNARSSIRKQTSITMLPVQAFIALFVFSALAVSMPLASKSYVVEIAILEDTADQTSHDSKICGNHNFRTMR